MDALSLTALTYRSVWLQTYENSAANALAYYWQYYLQEKLSKTSPTEIRRTDIAHVGESSKDGVYVGGETEVMQGSDILNILLV